MPDKLTSILIAVIGILLIILCLGYSKIQKLNATIVELELKAEFLDMTLKEEQTKFKHTIQRVEDELNQYVLNQKAYQCSVSEKTEAIDSKTKEEESKIICELQSDSSSDNQLNIARRLLHEFNSQDK